MCYEMPCRAIRNATCEGDYCVDICEKDVADPNKDWKCRRTCLDFLASNQPKKQGTHCTGGNDGTTQRSTCACGDSDDCLGMDKFSILDFSKMTTTCPAGKEKDSKIPAAKCVGERCVYNKKAYGCQAGDLDLPNLSYDTDMSYSLPWGLVGCMLTGYAAPPTTLPSDIKCSCDGNDCSENPPEYYLADRPLIECQYGPENLTLPCHGHYCGISMTNSLGFVTQVSECVLFSGHYNPVQGCYKTGSLNPLLKFERTECICQTPNCNTDIASAIASIENPVKPTFPPTSPSEKTTPFQGGTTVGKGTTSPVPGKTTTGTTKMASKTTAGPLIFFGLYIVAYLCE